MDTIIKDFKKLQESGNVTLGKVGKAHVLSIRRFDPATGIEVDSVVHAVDVEMLVKIKVAAQDVVTNVDYALSEIEKIK